MIYMFMAGDRQAVKIGVAENIERRRAEVQVGNHLAISIYRTFEGDIEQEIILHQRFAHLHVRGEWFSWSREMEGDVGLREIVEVAHAPLVLGSPSSLSEAFDRSGLKGAEIARAAGVAPCMVSHWRAGRHPMRAEHAIRIEEITGISRATLRPDLWPAENTPS